MPYTEITELSELQHIFEKKSTCIVYYGAKWCKPCNQYINVFDTVSNIPEYNDLSFYKVDIDRVEECKEECGVFSLPLTVIYANGKEENRFIGNDTNKLVDLITSVLTIPTSPTNSQ